MRRRVLAVGVVGTLLIVGVLWWFWWVPSWRPSPREGERYGVDVSAHQGAIEWDAVARDGIEFAYVKATEGGDFADERFPNHNVSPLSPRRGGLVARPHCGARLAR